LPKIPEPEKPSETHPEYKTEPVKVEVEKVAPPEREILKEEDITTIPHLRRGGRMSRSAYI
jgi:hypothetical protein